MERKLPEALVNGERGFNLEAAHFLAEMSELAYNGSNFIYRHLYDLGGIDWRFIQGQDSQCFYVKFPTFSVVAFRGTELDVDDIWTDLKFRKKDLEVIGGEISDGLGSVHRGFYQAYKALLPDLNDLFWADENPVYMTGHSLGGALAVLSGIDLDGPGARIVYTFGSPRVGNSLFAHNTDTWPGMHIHHRVVNSVDVVPMLPFMAMGYKHSGDLQYIDSCGCAHAGIPLHRQLFDQFKTLVKSILKGKGWLGVLPKGPFKCHGIDAYQEALEKAAQHLGPSAS